MPGCAENIINIQVFVRFAVLERLEFHVSRGMLWASFWEAWVTLGSLFLDFEAIGKRLEFHRIFDDFRGVPESCAGRVVFVRFTILES